MKTTHPNPEPIKCPTCEHEVVKCGKHTHCGSLGYQLDCDCGDCHGTGYVQPTEPPTQKAPEGASGALSAKSYDAKAPKGVEQFNNSTGEPTEKPRASDEMTEEYQKGWENGYRAGFRLSEPTRYPDGFLEAERTAAVEEAVKAEKVRSNAALIAYLEAYGSDEIWDYALRIRAELARPQQEQSSDV